ncbi:MAG: Dabb family protein [Eubacteriaceae bacterium]|nr:Dabb family protein [Eubacteriaceae bacterium]
MLHHIIVKWNEDVDKNTIAEEVRAMYAKATQIEGIIGVEIKENIIPRDNRYDLMIVLEMDKDSLSNWDDSELHKQWKSQFSQAIEKKCIFDC